MREISSIKKKILKHLENKGVSAYEFYQKSGVSNGVLSQKGGISEDNIMKFLSVFPDVDANWLLKDQDYVINNREYSASEPEALYEKKGVPLIPSSAIAGSNSVGLSISNSDIEAHINIPFIQQKSDWAIRVEGNSMVPTLLHGSYVMFRSIELSDLKVGKVYLINIDHAPVIKRLYLNHDNTITCRSDNHLYRDFKVNLNQVTYLAEITAVITPAVLLS
jgi:phage repressor protein C with HTH and peptisase S24 domain